MRPIRCSFGCTDDDGLDGEQAHRWSGFLSLEAYLDHLERAHGLRADRWRDRSRPRKDRAHDRPARRRAAP